MLKMFTSKCRKMSLAGTIFLLLIYLSAAVPCSAQKLSAVQNYAINRPGVVMIKTEFSATVFIGKIRMDNREFNALLDSIQRMDSAGVIFPAEQKIDFVIREMSNKPSRFFKRTSDFVKQEERITATGTGFFFTGDGYVATNAHLIDRDNSFIRRQFILNAYRQITDANIDALQISWATTFTEQQRNLLYTAYASMYSRILPMNLQDLKKEVFVSFMSDGDGKEEKIISRRANIVSKGEAMPGKDVAILKIETGEELPTLKLSGDELPQVGEQLFVYGYPGPATNNDFVSYESAIEPTLTTGIVSALKKSIGGWPVIQMDANINHGSSGGPVCNENGEVVGLTTFGSLENSGELAAGLNFAIPVTILHEYLESSGVKPGLSKVSSLFIEGISLVNRQEYKSAISKFEDVRKVNRYYPNLDMFVKDAKGGLNLKKDKESVVLQYILLVIGLSLVVLLVISLLRQRKRLHH